MKTPICNKWPSWLNRLVRPIVRRWDWWIYRRAFHSLRRMARDNPGMSYLIELHMREHNARYPVSESLKSATELFHEACKSRVPNAKSSDGGRTA